MVKILKKYLSCAGLIALCFCCMQSLVYAGPGSQTTAKYRANLWLGHFPREKLPADFSGGNPSAVVPVNAVTVRYDVKVVVKTEDGQFPEKVKMVTSLVHPDPLGASEAFIEVPAPCLFGCIGVMKKVPNVQEQMVTIELLQTVKRGCIDCRRNRHDSTTPKIVTDTLKKEPFAAYSVTYNWKFSAPTCDVQKIADSMVSSEPYLRLVQNPDMPSCSVANPNGACYQDELMGTDCSTAIYQVNVIVSTGKKASGVLLLPCDAEAILLYEILLRAANVDKLPLFFDLIRYIAPLCAS